MAYAYEEMAELVEKIPGGYPAVLVALLVGLLGVLLICVTRGNKGNTEVRSEGEESGESDNEKVKQQPKPKYKQPHAPKKVLLPPHPLLAGEFKGHTGSILSLDFDTNGKYLGSCSDGQYIFW